MAAAPKGMADNMAGQDRSLLTGHKRQIKTGPLHFNEEGPCKQEVLLICF